MAAKFPLDAGQGVSKEVKKSIVEAYLATDREFLQKAAAASPVWKDGSTAVSVLLVDHVLYAANLGDSKAILVRPAPAAASAAPSTADALALAPEPAVAHSAAAVGATSHDPVLVHAATALSSSVAPTAAASCSTAFSTSAPDVHASSSGTAPTSAPTATASTSSSLHFGPAQAGTVHEPAEVSSSGAVDPASTTAAGPSARRPLVCLRLTKDHAPAIYEERMRIQRAGGMVKDGRLMGIVEVSRCFGDGRFKRLGAIATPDVCVCVLEKDEHDTFVLMACDGVWKTFGVDAAAAFVADELAQQDASMPMLDRAQLAVNALVNEAVRRGSNDNVTAILVTIRSRVA